MACPVNLLAMPPSLRWLTIRHSATITQHISARHASTTTGSSSSARPPKPPPPREPLSYLPTPSNNPSQSALPAPSPSSSALDAANTIFTHDRPKLLFTAARFLSLPFNTRIPEICILGRSNVGKSTLINALTGLGGLKAGTAHGVQARREGLAITSRKAGCTKTMNGYGFGRVRPDVLKAFLRDREAENKALEAQAGSMSRTERRELKKRPREAVPSCALVVVDMPGYGHASIKEWGVEIEKYLSRRAKAAVLLVDATVGLNEGDRMVLEMLKAHRVRTLVILTKGDKLLEKEAVRDKHGRGQKNGGLSGACVRVWAELRRMEGRHSQWTEGDGWEREIWVTGAGDRRNGPGLGVEGARWAICKLAGLVEDGRTFDAGSEDSPAEVEVVSFDDIVWAPAPSKEDNHIKA